MTFTTESRGPEISHTEISSTEAPNITPSPRGVRLPRVARLTRAWEDLARAAISLASANDLPGENDTSARDKLVSPGVLTQFPATSPQARHARRLLAESWIGLACHYELAGAEDLRIRMDILRSITEA